jgi:hypothetical protein
MMFTFSAKAKSGHVILLVHHFSFL